MTDILNLALTDKPYRQVIDSRSIDQLIDRCKQMDRQNESSGGSIFYGIDFEFNMNWKTKDRYISIMQLIVIDQMDKYFDKLHKKYIYLIDFPKLNDRQKKDFIRYIFCSKIIKIFHGSDSLDYPYVYKLMNGSTDQFTQFINSSVDVRFYCEISKRFMKRLGMIEITNNKCSLYNSLYDHQVINHDLFESLEKIASKINYRKDWNLGRLKIEQILYCTFDVAYLYDIMFGITNRIRTVDQKNTDNSIELDVLSMVNRLYRFHMLNRLGIIDHGAQCKTIVDGYSIGRDNMLQFDQHIVENHLVDIYYSEHKVSVYLEDLLDINTTRKSILNCMRVYQIDRNQQDTDRLDKIFQTSAQFNKMKGKKTIMHLLDLIRNKKNKEMKSIKCEK